MAHQKRGAGQLSLERDRQEPRRQKEISTRSRQIARVLWVTLALNWAVAAAKVLFGLATQCMVIVADGFHSFSDGASNIIGLCAIYIAGYPADRDHPYGHQKYETLASVIIAFLLFVVALGILKEAILGLVHPRSPEVNATSFVIMAVTLAVNLFVVWFERSRGKALKSDLLLSDSWHTLTDVFITLSVFAALIGIHFNLRQADSIFTFLIAGVILITAVNILKRSSDVLCDKAVIETEKIDRIVRKVQGVRDCHEVRTRGRMDAAYVDLHVLVDNEMTVRQAHHLANVIEGDIRRGIPGVQDVVVHIEPVSHEHEEI